ncbi:MAG: hypothetical protein ABSF38_01425 [Verrucomicrobiota bacterium]|jgi:hypothetical protein
MRWLMPLAALVSGVIVFACFCFATRLSNALVLEVLGGTAVVLILFFCFRRRAEGWFRLLFELTILAIAVVIYFCVPIAGFQAAGLFASFAISILCLTELCECLLDKRPA